MFLYGALSGFLCIWFGRNVRRSAPISHTPMIKYPWQMLDLIGPNLFHTAQHQIMVLRAFKADAKTADSPNQVGSVDAQVRDKVLRQQKLRVPTGFEIWIRTPTSCIELVFVGVEQLQSSIFVESQGYEIERSWGQLIVMVQQRHKIARCHAQRLVRCG